MKEPKEIFKVGRRHFLKTSVLGTSGLLLGVSISCNPNTKFIIGAAPATFSPSVYLSIDEKGKVTIIAHRAEMGTGVKTTLPVIVADELEADWEQVQIIQADGDEKYGDQNTDGSYSIRMFYEPMRKVGATARYLLEQAAANEWKVDKSECYAKDHLIHNKTGKTFGFGYLADKASKLPLPEEKNLQLKTDAEFKFITKNTSIYDLKNIVTGKAQYGMDLAIPGASVAVISRPPAPGDEFISFEPKHALTISGVQKVFSIEPTKFPAAYNALGGVVVVADNIWAAIKGRDALEIEWRPGPNRDYNSSTYKDDLIRNTKKKGKVQRSAGDIDKSIKEANKKVVADYYVPHYAHTPMETPCAIADVNKGFAELWAPTQIPQWTRGAVADALGFKTENVTIHVTLLGGGFGRKSKPDFPIEAALISKECGYPIKLLWTREDDVQHDLYHACSAHHLEVSIDENNKVNGWLHRAAQPSIDANEDASLLHPANYELSQGMVDMPYDIPNIRMETGAAKAKTRIGWMRSVSNINNGFAIGSFMDEIALAQELDPIDNVLDLLGDDRKIDLNSMVKDFHNYYESLKDYPWDTGRFRKVIESVREQSNWNTKLPNGTGMGFAAHRSFLTYVACVVEVKVEGEKIEISNVYYSVDCGIAVNPDRIKAQFEGGAVFATNLLFNEITMKNGIVEQENFHNYPLVRISNSPKNIDVQIIESKEKPTGVGEPPVPPLAPAICNAIFNATGKRIRSLPIELS